MTAARNIASDDIAGCVVNNISKWKTVCIAAGAMCLSLSAGTASANVIWQFQDVGTSVLSSFSGSINVSLSPTVAYVDVSGINPSFGQAFGNTGSVDTYLVAGPASFGSGSPTNASSATGSVFAIDGTNGIVAVPTGYTSGSPLSGEVNFDGATFSSMGIIPGTYVYSLANESSVTLEFISATPLPAALPLFASALCALGLFGWLRKKKAAAVAA